MRREAAAFRAAGRTGAARRNGAIRSHTNASFAEKDASSSLSQDNNATEDAAAESRANWETMLESLKQVVEGR